MINKFKRLNWHQNLLQKDMDIPFLRNAHKLEFSLKKTPLKNIELIL